MLQGKDSRVFFLSDGDEDYAMTLMRYDSGAYTLVGTTDATRKALLDFANGLMGGKTGTKQGSKAVSKPLSDKVNTLPDQADLAKMKALNEELKTASAAYYGDEESSLTDLEYDKKFDELRDLEGKTGFILPDSVTQDVGTEVKGKLPKVQHVDRLLSLDKTKEVGALKGLLAQAPEGELGVLSWKMDGLTILATYNEGILKQAVTRGNGKVGEDVTHNAKFFTGMPRRIPYKGELRVRGEAVISYTTFERINAELPDGQEPYKNPRNLVVGMVRRTEATKAGSVSFFPFGVGVTDPKYKPTHYGQSLMFLGSQGFKPVFHVTCGEEGIESAVAGFKSKIEAFDYPTDGLVYALDDTNLAEKLGNTEHHPRGAIAFKWADETQKTKLRSILWSASRTGVLTPVALFDAVELEGTTVKRASVHNLTMLRKLKLGKDDEISVYKANMIIPQIAENHTNSATFQAPTVCPVCGGATAIRVDTKGKAEPSEFVICTNPDCTAKNIKGLAHFAKRDCMNIDGVAEKTVQELVAEGFIRNALDFYTLKDHPEIAELPKWGKTSYNKLIYAVDTSRTTTLTQVIYSLGIKNVGRSASEALASYYKYIKVLQVDMTRLTEEEANASLANVEGIGTVMRGDIIAYFKANNDYIEKLVSNLTIGSGTSRKELVLSANIPKGAPNCLDGLSFCVTGKLEFEGARDALHTYIESLGGKAVSAVSKTTNYLITNTPNSGSSKNKKAQELGCKVISEASLFTLVKDLSEAITLPERLDNARIQEEIAKTPNASVQEIADTAMTQGVEIVKKVKVGDKVRLAYISDRNPHNAQIGTVLTERLCKYYPNGKADEFIWRQTCTIEYTDGTTENVADTDAKGSGLVSSLEVITYPTPTLTKGEQVVQAMVDSVEIPEDPREARIQFAEALQTFSGLPLTGLTLCVTGKVNYGTREELHRFIESKGGKIASSVTKGVDYLITNTPFSDTVKNTAAKANGCHIISESEFKKMLTSGQTPADYNNVPKPASPYVSSVSGSVREKTFCITGRVGYPGSRAGLQSYIRSLGGYTVDKVEYGVDYLITNNPFSGSTKNNEANRIGCSVITEDQFLEMAILWIK